MAIAQLCCVRCDDAKVEWLWYYLVGVATPYCHACSEILLKEYDEAIQTFTFDMLYAVKKIVQVDPGSLRVEIA